MDLKNIMQFNNFVVAGNTLLEEKYAYKIKHALLEHGYNVACIDKEYQDLSEIPFAIEILDLCIHPAKGLKILQDNTRDIQAVVIQPGAESPEIIDFLTKHNIPFIEGCLLVGLSLYPKN
ncbi:MAG: CoA-binding protein [Erysipelotrichaceae bacterium]|nr:CoA-binding protein [Erysipelotrichaceae bacterium]MDY5252988.1 CoA-binding protein [Erysipelotrichaceae bacterium]